MIWAVVVGWVAGMEEGTAGGEVVAAAWMAEAMTCAGDAVAVAPGEGMERHTAPERVPGQATAPLTAWLQQAECVQVRCLRTTVP